MYKSDIGLMCKYNKYVDNKLDCKHAEMCKEVPITAIYTKFVF